MSLEGATPSSMVVGKTDQQEPSGRGPGKRTSAMLFQSMRGEGEIESGKTTSEKVRAEL